MVIEAKNCYKVTYTSGYSEKVIYVGAVNAKEALDKVEHYLQFVGVTEVIELELLGDCA